MWLIAGLGNPTQSYSRTRHNAGFMVVDAIARTHGAAPFKAKYKSEFTTCTIGKQECLLTKPQTYMNLSGESIQAIMAFYKIPPARLLVIHDELDLPLGKLRMKLGGGHGGHNGLRDIDARVGKDYWRLRVGIGHPRDSATPQMDVADYVLTAFSADEKRAIEEQAEAIAAHLPLFFTHSPEGMMSKLAAG